MAQMGYFCFTKVNILKGFGGLFWDRGTNPEPLKSIANIQQEPSNFVNTV